MTARLSRAFEKAKAESRPALISFLIPGYPSLPEMAAVFDAMVEGGADIIEVEIPFSDPIADGPTIQAAVFSALENGTTPQDCIDFVRDARSRHADIPIVLMTYLNPVIAHGLDRFAADAAAAGTDAVILVDLPAEEAVEAREALAKVGMDLILLVAPTSSDERLKLIGSQASGFIYCVSVAGVTGARTELPPGLRDFIGRVRNCTNLPLAVGFGMSRRDHIEALTGVVDGVVVGSAFIERLGKAERQERPRIIREYLEVLSGHRGP